ncbi:MAG: TetR/AcrR family transcriptional repressor of nem operon [Desulforhopalus sp.]|jgi:TetR/AcrR family transcriptional repressor of nem operon
MARAQFDRNEVIEKSVELFWQNGFSGSSMQQVVETTGLKPGSIYLAFGSKESLFREALESYARTGMAKMHRVLDAAPSVGEGLCTILEGVVEDSTREDYCSCFLIKTRLELAAKENDLYDFASAKLGEVEALIESYLKKEFNKKLSKRRAASIMLHIFGLRVYGYQHGSVGRMREGLREGLAWLPWK